jgi:dTDP-glucose pyrophosphorylase
MQGVILAAGKGKRLQPVTPARTKAMAPVVGKPIVARVLDLFLQNGIREILLLISPDDADIRPYFEQQIKDDVTINFVVQHERLGMAHALTLLAPHLHGDFIMSACDNLVPAAHVAALLRTQREQQANAVLSLMEIDIAESASTGIVEWRNGWISRIVEKPQPAAAPSNIASLPLYVFAHKLIDYLPRVQPSARGEYELQDAIQLLIEDGGQVTGVLTPQRWQLTTVADLLELNRHFLTSEPARAQILTDALGDHVHLIPPVRIDPGCVIGDNCVIGPHVYLEANCQIGAAAQLSNAIGLRSATVAPAGTARDTIIMGG